MSAGAVLRMLFDETKSAWAKEYAELKPLLSEEEYISARESTLNAHYTSPVIIQGIYRTLQRMGFTKGNLLEPSDGNPKFLGCCLRRCGRAICMVLSWIVCQDE